MNSLRSPKLRNRRWKILPKHADAQAYAARLGIHPIMAQVLLNRGISADADARAFLSPSMKALHDPSLLEGIAPAAARLADAIRKGEKVVIYGDYDVDGITGTTILWHAITLLGGNVDYYIPHRLDEGYGLNAQAIAQICDCGAKLIISVDCGVTAVEEVAVACARGVDVIITDHHEWRPDAKLPSCLAIVHPRLPIGSASYPNPHLCGSGVAMKLAWATGLQFAGGNGRVSSELRDFLLNATSLAALATIADVVPLLGENRILAHFGLLALKSCNLPGLRALLESANLLNEKVDSFHVGFLLAPRLNACGRMGHASEAVEMLTRADAARALEIARALEQQNRERQNTERRIVTQALDQITRLGLDADDQRAIVVGSKGWHAGVIGIVASRIVDRYHRPAVVLSLDDAEGHGSGRSIAGFHLARAFSAMGDLLLASGGHEMAAGLTLRTERFDEFRTRFCQYAREQIAPDLLLGELRIEAEAQLADLSRPLVDALAKLGPFGLSNPHPILCCTAVELIADPNVVGQTGDHLQLRVRQGNTAIKCIAFKFGEMAPQLRRGMRVDLAAVPSLNTYNNMTSVQLDVKDIRIPAT